MNIFNEKEFNEICQRLNLEATIKEEIVTLTSKSFFEKMRKSIQEDRRGEVVFCVVRPNGKIIAVTSSEYPEGIFRIPTGGINYNEDIIEAVLRETKEELGLKVEIMDFASVIKIRLVHGDYSIMFYSYIFILKETGGRLLKDATDDEVSEVLEVNPEELKTLVQRLGSIKGKWSDWGKFRGITSGAVYEYFKP